MKFLKTHWYWLLVIGLGLGIGSIITVHRVQQQTSEPKGETSEVAEHTSDTAEPQLRTTPNSTGGKTSNNAVPRERRPMRMNTDARQTPAVTGSTHYDDGHPRRPPPLPADVLKRLDIKTNPKFRALFEANKLHDGPRLTLEASQVELEALTEGMNLEEAIAFLEEHGYFNRAILSQVSADRAFKYLKAIRAGWDIINEYAAKALAENPDNFEAKMKLMLSEKDNAKAAAGYREILAKDPNHVGALLNLAYRTHYEDPEGALAHMIRANKLDPTRGVGDIGMVYERLGDIKTAWLYYRKHLEIWPGDILIEGHFQRIYAGDPVYPPIHLERQKVLPREEADMDDGTVLPKEQRTPPTEAEPGFLERSPRETDSPEDRPTDAAAAQAELERWQAAAQKEFDAFMKWAERIMHEESVHDYEESVRDMDAFLAQELRAHLKGGKTEVSPERLVRAFELMQRHGRTDGLLRLKDKDPDLATDVERFLKEKRHPTRRNTQQHTDK